MSKKYIPNEKEKYMSAKQKMYFKTRLIEWKNEIIESNNKSLYLNEVDHEISSPDIIDQASSQTEKTVEMRTLNRQRKLLAKIDQAIKKINNYNQTVQKCHETVGVAILNTSITIIFGFSILVLSNFIPTIYFGVFTGIAMLLAMISVLTLLPKLILIVKPFGNG